MVKLLDRIKGNRYLMGERTQQLDKSIWSVASGYGQEALTDSHIQYKVTESKSRMSAGLAVRVAVTII